MRYSAYKLRTLQFFNTVIQHYKLGFCSVVSVFNGTYNTDLFNKYVAAGNHSQLKSYNLNKSVQICTNLMNSVAFYKSIISDKNIN